MSETRRTIKKAAAYIRECADFAHSRIRSAYQKIQAQNLTEKIKSVPNIISNLNVSSVRTAFKKGIHKTKSVIRRYFKRLKRISKKLSASWRILLICIPTFLFCYYGIGSILTENTDTSTEYSLRETRIPMLETPLAMSFLLKREVDGKMWTPNLPPVFPAYILDNMPNFQIGIVSAVKDVTAVLRRFNQNTEAQKKDIKNAYQYLQYPPNIWLMTKKGKFNLAPSSNAQYRKAAAELQQFAKDGVYSSSAADFDALLKKINAGLQNATSRNESHQAEHSADWIDTQADNLFYYNRGYAFAMWQIARVMGADYRETILENNAYTEWTYFANSLRKAAKLKPSVVRNGSAESLTAPNHLIMQNYYLLRAITAAEKIRNKILQESFKENNAD